MEDRLSQIPERLSALPQRLAGALRPRGFRRGLGRAAAAIGLTSVFFGSALCGVLLHLWTDEARRVTRASVNAALASVLDGRIELGEIELLTLQRARIREVHIYDPEGRLVISAEGVDGRVATAGLISSLFSDEGPVRLTITRARIERARVALVPNAEGIPSLADTFLPRDKRPSPGVSRPFLLRLPRIEIGEAEITGDVGARLDAEARRISASVHVDTADLVAVDVARASLTERQLMGVETSGTASYHLRVDLREGVDPASAVDDGPRSPLSMWATLSGTVAGIPASAEARMDGLELDARAALPSVEPAALAAVFPGLPLTKAVTVTASAKGVLPALTFEGFADIPQGAGMATVRSEGSVDLGDGVKLIGDIRVEELDPRLFFADVPEARLSGRARVFLALRAGDPDPRIAVEVATRAATIGAHVVPAIDAVLHLHRGTLLGSATLHEGGLPIDARVRVRDGAVAFSASTSGVAFGDSPRLAAWVSGTGALRVDGSLDEGRLHATARADLEGVASRVGPPLHATRATVSGTVAGPLDDLELEASAFAQSLTFGDEELDKVTLSVHGPIGAPSLRVSILDAERGTIDAAARLSLADRRLTGVTLDVARNGVRAKGAVANVAITDTGLVVEGARISGEALGEAQGSLRLERGDLIGSMQARDLDLGRAATLLALPMTMAGIANIDANIRRVKGGRSGHLDVELENGKLAGVDGLSARLSAKLDGERVTTSGYVRLTEEASDDERGEAAKKGLVGVAALCDGVVAEIAVAAEGAIGGPLFAGASWRDATGAVDLVADNWSLKCLADRIPARMSPFAEVAGVVSLRAAIERAAGDRLPSIREASAATRGLVLVGKDESFESRRLDLSAKGAFDGDNGTTSASVVVHGNALRAELEAASILDPSTLLDADKRAAAWTTTPFELDLSFPRRPLSDWSDLPEPLATILPPLAGQGRMAVEVWGTLERPELRVVAKGFGVALPVASALEAPLLPPIDATFDATYDPSEGVGQADLDLSLVDDRPVAALSVTARVPVADLPGIVRGVAPTWTASAFAQLFDFPLGSIPVLADRDVSGSVSGRLSVRDIQANPRVEAALSLHDVLIGGVAVDGQLEGGIEPRSPGEIAGMGAGVIDAIAAAESLGDASARIDLAHEGGSLQLLLYGGARWVGLMQPSLDEGSAGGVALSTKRFRLSTLHPLVAGAIPRLDGRLDGSLAVEWGRIGETNDGRFSSAKLDVSDVVLLIPQLGQELREGRGSIRLQGGERGEQELVVENVEAKGTSGRVTAEATATFQGLRFQRARGGLAIRQGEELPITVEGVPIGKARGKVDFRLALGEGEVAMDVDLTDTTIDLPASSGRNVQSLDPAPGVTITPSPDRPREARSSRATRWVVNVRVKDADVRSSLFDARLDTAAEAPIRLVLSDRLHADGDIVIERGRIQLQDRRFEVDQALIRLRDEDASNPYVNLTAHWDAPDGSRVFVDYVGLLQPITDDKIRFRSDPPRSQNEILALLLFGESGANATGLVGTVSSTVATSIAGNLVSAVFGGVLQDVAINVGANEDGNYLGAQVSVSEDWRIGGAYEQVGQGSGPGSDTQRRGGCADLFADWSFARNWSLRGSTGYCSYEEGTPAGGGQEFNLGIDVLWQYRY